jgi:hypothetical protein
MGESQSISGPSFGTQGEACATGGIQKKIKEAE